SWDPADNPTRGSLAANLSDPPAIFGKRTRRTSGRMALRPITETCEPRRDVLSGGLTDAHFAAQLDQVVRSPEKYPVYGDPTEFFAITYPTQGLRDLLTSTVGRLSGRGGHVQGAEHGVVRFQT